MPFPLPIYRELVDHVCPRLREVADEDGNVRQVVCGRVTKSAAKNRELCDACREVADREYRRKRYLEKIIPKNMSSAY